MTTITPVELNKLLAQQPALTLIDVRTPAEFGEVHVAQARNVPLDKLDPKTIPQDQPVYILCRSGARATKAAEKIAHSVVIEGGTLAWIEADLPVTRGTTKVISLERQVRIGTGTLVLTGVLLGWFVHRGFYGLAGFVGAGLIFAGITDFCGLAIILGKMPWNTRQSS